MRKFLRFFTLMLVMVLGIVGAQAQELEQYWLFHSETNNSVGNDGDKAIVGADLYKSFQVDGKSWTPSDPNNGQNYNMTSFTEDEKEQHENEVNPNSYYKVPVKPITYYQLATQWVQVDVSQTDNNFQNSEGWVEATINEDHIGDYYDGACVRFLIGETVTSEYYIVTKSNYNVEWSTALTEDDLPEGITPTPLDPTGVNQWQNEFNNNQPDGVWYYVVEQHQYEYHYYKKMKGWSDSMSELPEGETATFKDWDASDLDNHMNENAGYYALASSFNYYFVETETRIEWRLENYTDGQTQYQLVALYNDEDMETPSAVGSYCTVGGQTYSKEDGQWKSDAVPVETNWDESTGILTVGTDETRTVSELMSVYNITKDDVSTVNFADGSTYDKETGKLTPASGDYANLKTQLENAGFTVNSISLGRYVSVLDDGTIVINSTSSSATDQAIETALGNGSETYPKMTNAEKAILNSTNTEPGKIKLVGGFSYDEIGLLTGYMTPSDLDLSDAILETNVNSTTVFNDTNWKEHLTSIKFPTDPNFTRIPDNMMEGYTNLESVDFPNNITAIGNSSFKNTGIKYLVLPKSISVVGNSAFMECKQMETFEMEILEPGTQCVFGTNVFETCSALKHVSLSEGVPAISAHMFDKCGMLESIRIPTTAENIETQAFEGCASLHFITIPVGVKKIYPLAFNNAGLSDIYIMAEKKEDVPQILSLGNSESSFNTHQVNGDFNSPKEGDYKHHTPEEASDLSEEELLRWYQEEQSNKNYEIGGNDCLVALHYPKEMKPFYDGISDPYNGGTAWANYLDGSVNGLTRDRKGKEKWNDEITPRLNDLQYISDTYAITSGFSDYPNFIDKDGKGWPTTPDYEVCLAAGYAEGYSTLGWRQFPIKKGAAQDDFIYSKEYDDTWYTMCYPWDMEDNQLFSAFNQKCEISEFVGAEVVDVTPENSGNVKYYNLIFHFDQVANTYYMTKNHREDGKQYIRIDHPTYTRTENVDLGTGVTVKKNYYTYQSVSDPTDLVYWPIGGRETDEDMCNLYLGIKHLIVFAGHPYMIHPSIGANPNLSPVTCTIVGVTKLFPDDNPALEQLALDSVVTKRTTINGKAYHTPGTTYFEDESYYTFIGNINDYSPDETPRKMMTSPENPVAYFLALDPDEKGVNPYPKYYRKSNKNESRPSWSQYSAIIRPDAGALESIEKYMVLGSNAGGSAGGAKGVDVEFGKWEVVTPTEIQQILVEAEEKGQEVKEIHLNVVFNIKGQVVRQGTTSVEGLPQGMYIVNGKKYMVK